MKHEMLKNHQEMFEALLAGKELASPTNNGTLKMIDGQMVFMNSKWQYVNPRDWYIKDINKDYDEKE